MESLGAINGYTVVVCTVISLELTSDVCRSTSLGHNHGPLFILTLSMTAWPCFDLSRNSKTFRPKKSAPSGSKVSSSFSCVLLDSFPLLLCSKFYPLILLSDAFYFWKCRVLNFKSILMLHWVVGTCGKL